MEIKITGRSQKVFENNLTHFLNLSTMIIRRGEIPTKSDIDNAEQYGMWWYKDLHDRYQLLPVTNDYWLNVIGQGDNYIIVEYNFRYDRGLKKETITNLMGAWFDFVEILSN
jgi:hypothetical protein